jgi:hypothetical protein
MPKQPEIQQLDLLAWSKSGRTRSLGHAKGPASLQNEALTISSLLFAASSRQWSQKLPASGRTSPGGSVAMKSHVHDTRSLQMTSRMDGHGMLP